MMKYENQAYDAACKRVLSEKPILAWIMKLCMDEYKNCDIHEIADKYIEGEPEISTEPVTPETGTGVITGIDTADKSPDEGAVYFDILYKAKLPDSNESAAVIINIESQNAFYTGYALVKRGIYYCCRLISSQFKGGVTHSEYNKLEKVYSVFICIRPSDYRKNTITRYSMAEDTLFGQSREDPVKYDLMSLVMVCLGKPDKHNPEILEILDTLFDFDISAKEKTKKLYNDYGIKLTGSTEKEADTMSDLAQGVFDYGMEKGIDLTLLDSIKNITKNLGLTDEQAMAALGIPESRRQKYWDMLKNSGVENTD